MEILFILSMLIPTVFMGIFKIWALFWVFCGLDVVLILAELFYVKTTGKTVSQHFWKWSKENKGKALIVLGSMGLMFATLIFHLGYKIFQ